MKFNLNREALLFCLIALLGQVQAQDSEQHFIKELSLAHKIMGCPENSLCSKKLGERHKKWLELLRSQQKTPGKAWKKIESFRKKYGIPVPVLANAEALKKDLSILWDSPCSQHQKHGLYQGLSFLKNSKKLPSEIHLDPLVIKKQKWLIPYRERPQYFNQNKTYFILEDGALYYGLSISTNGDWKVIDPNKMITKSSFDTQCSKKTMTKLTRNEEQKYQKKFCRRYWDQGKKEHQEVLLSWSCL